jgi:GxxExxY protein
METREEKRVEFGTQEIRKRMGKELKEKELTDRIIGAAIAVHRTLGPGFLESIYEEALSIEFDEAGISYERQKTVPLMYRNRPIGEHRLDLLVGGHIVVELKAIAALEKIHFSVVRSYMKAVGCDVGLILNFATMPLTVKRVGRERSDKLNEEFRNS